MKFKKSLGQNFLVDKNITKKILSLADLKNKDVIEIGPGTGNLTNEILKSCSKNALGSSNIKSKVPELDLPTGDNNLNR